jgi:hypothetical protein
MWFRVFGTSEKAPEPAALLEHLQKQGVKVEGHFKGDDLGWFGVDFVLPDNAEPLHMDRYLAEEDEIREQLNAWAAWLETIDDPVRSGQLMQLMIGANQVFTLECSRDRLEEKGVAHLCQELCQYLAQVSGGVYQVDNRGFFAADGKLLVKE